MLSLSSRPGTTRFEYRFCPDARMKSTHTAQNSWPGLRFLNPDTASIPPPMALILKERFSPNTGRSPFYISEGTLGMDRRWQVSPLPQNSHFLNRDSASISPPIWLILKGRFLPNPGDLHFIFPNRTLGCHS